MVLVILENTCMFGFKHVCSRSNSFFFRCRIYHPRGHVHSCIRAYTYIRPRDINKDGIDRIATHCMFMHTRVHIWTIPDCKCPFVCYHHVCS